MAEDQDTPQQAAPPDPYPGQAPGDIAPAGPEAVTEFSPPAPPSTRSTSEVVAPPDPYADRPQPSEARQQAPASPQTPRSEPAPPDPRPGSVASSGDATPPRNPWASSNPPMPVKDPAVRMDSPPDPYPNRAPAALGQNAGGGGVLEQLAAGLARIERQNDEILERMRGGSTF